MFGIQQSVFASLIDPEAAERLVVTVFLSAARIGGVLAIHPVFSLAGIRGFVRGGIVLALSLVIMPGVFEHLSGASALPWPVLAGLLVKEFAFGCLLGLVLGLPFWAAQACGSFLDNQRGAAVAVSLGSRPGEKRLVLSDLFFAVVIGLMAATGGLLLMLEAVYRTFEIWRPWDLLPTPGTASVTAGLGLLDQLVRAGFLLAAPIMIIMLVSELALAIMTRFAPQLNVFIIALAVKCLIIAAILPIYLFTMSVQMKDRLVDTLLLSELLRAFLP